MADLESGLECTVFGKVTTVGESHNFTRKNGSPGTVVNLEITDDTGSCRLVLWNKDVELVKNKTIQQGTHNKQLINNLVEGTLISMEATNAFFRDNGEFGFVTKIKIKEKDDVKQLTVWDEKVKEIQRFKQGDSIEITNVDKRQKNGNAELHVNGNSTIKKA